MIEAFALELHRTVEHWANLAGHHVFTIQEEVCDFSEVSLVSVLPQLLVVLFSGFGISHSRRAHPSEVNALCYFKVIYKVRLSFTPKTRHGDHSIFVVASSLQKVESPAIICTEILFFILWSLFHLALGFNKITELGIFLFHSRQEMLQTRRSSWGSG